MNVQAHLMVPLNPADFPGDVATYVLDECVDAVDEVADDNVEGDLDHTDPTGAPLPRGSVRSSRSMTYRRAWPPIFPTGTRRCSMRFTWRLRGCDRRGTSTGRY